MANAPSPSSSMRRVRYDPNILKYVDLHAKESREDGASSKDMGCEILTYFTIRLVPKLKQRHSILVDF